MGQGEESLKPAATLLLYTDGLIERPGENVEDRLHHLREEAAALARESLSTFCDAILDGLGAGSTDDIALLAIGMPPAPGTARRARSVTPREIHSPMYIQGVFRKWRRPPGGRVRGRPVCAIAGGGERSGLRRRPTTRRATGALLPLVPRDLLGRKRAPSPPTA
ncbi:SpoIIE family protein phosphatase [Streptomyces sp. NPDC001732]